DRLREAVPAAYHFGPRRGAGPDALPDGEGVDPVAEHGEQRGQDGERGDHVDRDRGHAAVAHGAQEDRLEQHQARQRERDRDPGDEDGAARGGHGPRDGALYALLAAQFLAEPGDDEQAVVDAEAEAHDRGDVDRVDRDRGG